MATAQITLTPSESEAIQALSESMGKTQDEIVHEAIERFLSQNKAESRPAALHQARGIWQGRQDLPDPTELRSEWNRL